VPLGIIVIMSILSFPIAEANSLIALKDTTTFTLDSLVLFEAVPVTQPPKVKIMHVRIRANVVNLIGLFLLSIKFLLNIIYANANRLHLHI